MRFFGEELCIFVTLFFNNVIVRNYFDVGNKILSIGNKKFGVNISYVGSCLGMLVVIW